MKANWYLIKDGHLQKQPRHDQNPGERRPQICCPDEILAEAHRRVALRILQHVAAFMRRNTERGHRPAVIDRR